MKNIKAIIFDFNGTMIHDSEFHRRVWYEFIPRYTGRRVTYEEIDAKILGRDNDSILKCYLGEHLTDREIAELTHEKEAAYRRLCLENKEQFKFVDGKPYVYLPLHRGKVVKRPIEGLLCGTAPFLLPDVPGMNDQSHSADTVADLREVPDDLDGRLPEALVLGCYVYIGRRGVNRILQVK